MRRKDDGWDADDISDEFSNDDFLKNRLNVSRYTRDAWKKVFGENAENLWEDKMQKYNAAYYLADMLTSAGDDVEVPTMIGQVVIGEEYFNWLDENGLESTQENRLRYVTEISFEEADFLMKK